MPINDVQTGIMANARGNKIKSNFLEEFFFEWGHCTEGLACLMRGKGEISWLIAGNEEMSLLVDAVGSKKGGK